MHTTKASNYWLKPVRLWQHQMRYVERRKMVGMVSTWLLISGLQIRLISQGSFTRAIQKISTTVHKHNVSTIKSGYIISQQLFSLKSAYITLLEIFFSVPYRSQSLDIPLSVIETLHNQSSYLLRPGDRVFSCFLISTEASYGRGLVWRIVFIEWVIIALYSLEIKPSYRGEIKRSWNDFNQINTFHNYFPDDFFL